MPPDARNQAGSSQVAGSPGASVRKHAPGGVGMGYVRGVDRRDPAATADERSTLEQFLDFQRATLLWKAEGLTDEQLAMTTAASSLTLGGLLKHAALVARPWSPSAS